MPPVAAWRGTRLPQTMSAAEVDAVVDSCDRSTVSGRRDRAILVLLARLGLRSGEVAALRLGDVDWRAGEITVRGKARRTEGFPGTVSIGHDALRLLLVEFGRSMLRWAGRLLVVNGHGGNLASLSPAVIKLRGEGRDVAWWPCTWPDTDLHAGHAETSMMLRLRHPAVRQEHAVGGPTDALNRLLDRLVAESVHGVGPSGVLGDPAGANERKGDRLLARMAAKLARDIRGWDVSDQGRLGIAA